MKCKTCGEKYHYCTSCGYANYHSEGYCNKECFQKSKFYNDEKGQFYNLLDRMDEDTIRGFKLFLLTRSYMLDDDYIKWIEKYK